MQIFEAELPRDYGEHMGDVRAVALLRAEYLGFSNTPEDRQAFGDNLVEMMVGKNRKNDGHFMAVAPVDETGRLLDVCAYGIARYREHGSGIRAVVEELLVVPEHRRLGLATWMLGEMATYRFKTGRPSPRELVVDPSRLESFHWWCDKLRSEDFLHKDEKGNPSLWLPGAYARIAKSEAQSIPNRMPNDWNGFFEFYVDSGDKNEKGIPGEIYRDGKLIGTVQRVALDTGEPVNDIRHPWEWKIYIASSKTSQKIPGGSLIQACAKVLNHPDVVRATESQPSS